MIWMHHGMGKDKKGKKVLLAEHRLQAGCMCCSIWSWLWSEDSAGVLQAAVKQLRFNLLKVLGQLGDLAPSVLLAGAVLLLLERGKPKSGN